MRYAILFLLLLSACRTNYAIFEIDQSQQKFDDNYSKSDTLIASKIAPYKQELRASMGGIIAHCTENLVKTKPESTLGNLLADATLNIAQRQSTEKVDLAIINYGGIRVPSINKGPVSLGNVYELMPFDNYLVLIKIDGNTLLSLSNAIAASGGWPISGFSFTIKNNEAHNIKINKSPIELNKTYTVAISDYLANGGDNLSMLKSFKQHNTNILLRDAFIQYFREQEEKGKELNATLENRISYE